MDNRLLVEHGHHTHHPQRRSLVRCADCIRAKRGLIYQTFDDPTHSGLAKAIAVTVLMFIVISIVDIIIEQEAFAQTEPIKSILSAVETVAIIVFTIEFLVRLATCPHLGRFVSSVLNWIDLLSVAPFWISLLLTSSYDLSFLRTLRLLRIFRIFKTGRYSVGAQIYAGTFARSARHLYLMFFMVCILVVVLSSTINLLEWSNGPPSAQTLSDFGRTLELQRICFGTILSSFWWTLVTITTVGFGECTPITTAGKVVGGITTLIGTVCLSMPIAIIGNSFVRMVDVFDGDSTQETTKWSRLDVREYVWALRQEGSLRADVPEATLHIDALMRAFDADHDGVLQPDEVARLKEHTRHVQEAPVEVSSSASAGSSQRHGGRSPGDASKDPMERLLAAQSEQLAAMSAALQRQQALAERQDERMARLETMLAAVLGGAEQS